MSRDNHADYDALKLDSGRETKLVSQGRYNLTRSVISVASSSSPPSLVQLSRVRNDTTKRTDSNLFEIIPIARSTVYLTETKAKDAFQLPGDPFRNVCRWIIRRNEI